MTTNQIEARYDATRAAMEAAALAYDESDEDADLLAAYLQAKKANAIAMGTFHYGPIGGELIIIGHQLADARADVDRLTAMAAEKAQAAHASEANIPQTEIARYLGVDRMTVRKWLGL